MGYMHIENLYKPRAQDILMFRECYALEKIHGTSAHISIRPANDVCCQGISYFSGGVSKVNFQRLLSPVIESALVNDIDVDLDQEITLYGEAYGGSCMKMSSTYGKDLKFIVFDVKIGDCWLDVPNAANVAHKFGLEFVDYRIIATEIGIIDAERDRPSVQAVRNGMGADKAREGIVLRPLAEMTRSNGTRVISKHKGEGYEETKTKREVSPEQLAVLSDAIEVADEWVTEMRLGHVLSKLEGEQDMTIIPKLIPAMIEDVKREGSMEIEWSKEVSTAIGRRAVVLMKESLQLK